MAPLLAQPPQVRQLSLQRSVDALHLSARLDLAPTSVVQDALTKELPKDRLSDGSPMPTIFISAVAGKGITQLKDLLWDALNRP